jgi:hypothetical protein
VGKSRGETDLPKTVLRRRLARQVLADLVKERKASVRDIVGRYNQAEFVKLRVEFMRRAYAAGVGSPIIGRIIKRDHSTVLYHLKGGRARRAARLAREAAAHVQ